ncbi:MAG: hypothetical protein IT355_05315 [Gemmatimonadaceae bacterium]|nr:hypothetical protein [Gemmatimonadaceae bacterium]
MSRLDLDAALARATAIGRFLVSGDQLMISITGALLLLAFVLAIIAIWRGRRREARQPAMSPEASGFTRWLTPMGMMSIPAEQAVVNRPRRRSGSVKTVKVHTPVSKVSARALKNAGADALEIARRTGLSRDAVVMMMAKADPRAAAARTAASKAVVPKRDVTRTVYTESRSMVEPSTYGHAEAARTAPKSRALGTRFTARLG